MGDDPKKWGGLGPPSPPSNTTPCPINLPYLKYSTLFLLSKKPIARKTPTSTFFLHFLKRRFIQNTCSRSYSYSLFFQILGMSTLLEQSRSCRICYNSWLKPVDFLRRQGIRLKYCRLCYGSPILKVSPKPTSLHDMNL